MIICFRLNAGNDASGNPRMAVVFHDTEENKTWAVDEGYNGYQSFIRELEAQGKTVRYVGMYETTPRQYRGLVR